MWIDTHCHLDAAEFDADRDAVVARASEAGVTQIVLPAVEAGNFGAVRDLAARHGLGFALGIHPLCVPRAVEPDLQTLRQEVQRALDGDQGSDAPRLLGIGEIGLDHFVAGVDLARQERFCVAQLRLARDFDLPVILHSRRAVDTLLKHLRALKVRGGIAHAFNGSEQQAQAFIGLGFKLGFGGAMTFDRALQLRRLAVRLPLDAIVLETDAPDIPPHWLYRTAAERSDGLTGPGGPGRQARNEPGELARIGTVLAELREMTPAALAAATSTNARVALPGLA